jgi:hypothetical protein
MFWSGRGTDEVRSRLNAVRADISHDAASTFPTFPNATGNQLWLSLITKVRTLIGSPVDGIIDVVGPIVALFGCTLGFRT